MPSKKRARKVNKPVPEPEVTQPEAWQPDFSLERLAMISPATVGIYENQEELTKAVNQYLAPEDRIGHTWPSHPLDRDSRALRAYYRAQATHQHYAAKIALCEERGESAHRLRCSIKLTPETKGDEIQELLVEAYEECENADADSTLKKTVMLNLLHTELLCYQTTTALVIKQIHLFTAEKLFMLESEEKERWMKHLEKCESTILSHNAPGTKSTCRCPECHKEEQILQSAKVRTSETSQFQKVIARRNKGTPLVAALEYQKLLRTIIADIRALSRSIHNSPSGAGYASNELTFMSLPVPGGWSKEINTAVRDLEVIILNIDHERHSLLDQRNEIRRWLLLGMSGSDKLWKEKLEMVSDYPDFQRYEYTRNSVLAAFVSWRIVEEKIHKYIRKKGIKLDADLNKALGLERREQTDWRTEFWEESFASMKSAAITIEDMLTQSDETRKLYSTKNEEEATAKNGEWWRVLVGKKTAKNPPAP